MSASVENSFEAYLSSPEIMRRLARNLRACLDTPMKRTLDDFEQVEEIRSFLASRTRPAPGRWITGLALYEAYAIWTSENDRPPMTLTAFGRKASGLLSRRRVEAGQRYLHVELMRIVDQGQNREQGFARPLSNRRKSQLQEAPAPRAMREVSHAGSEPGDAVQVDGLLERTHSGASRLTIAGRPISEVSTSEALAWCDRRSADVLFLRRLCHLVADPRKTIGEQLTEEIANEAKLPPHEPDSGLMPP